MSERGIQAIEADEAFLCLSPSAYTYLAFHKVAVRNPKVKLNAGLENAIANLSCR